MSSNSTRLVARLVESVAFGVILFLAAGTLDYWQAWVFLVVFNLAGWIPGIYLMRTIPLRFSVVCGEG